MFGGLINIETKYTNEDLKEMQAWPLERKIQVTQTRILEWLTKWGGCCYVSFSGGKDSTVLLDLCRRVDPNMSAVFINTGLEFPEIRAFVKTVPNVTWLKPEMNFRQVIETYGYPVISKEVSQKIYEARKKPDGVVAGRFQPESEYATKYGGRYSMVKWNNLKDSDIPISHKCCYVMKKQPAYKYERKSGNRPIVGTMACESALRKNQWLRKGCNAFDGKRPISNPLSFWTEQDILEYLVKFNIPYCSIYGDILKNKSGKWYTTGANRTGCMACMFGVHLEKNPNRFQRLKETHPQIWEGFMKPLDEGGLGMKEVLEYIGVEYE